MRRGIGRTKPHGMYLGVGLPRLRVRELSVWGQYRVERAEAWRTAVCGLHLVDTRLALHMHRVM